MRQRFIIGIGSQRAGSTLLHRILDAGTDVYMHPMKELHYFDTIFGIRSVEVLKKYSANQLEREIGRICGSGQFGFINKRYKNYIRTAMMGAFMEMQSTSYKDLFRPCVMDNVILGEVTPEYMLLPPEGIDRMAAEVGDDAVIILLARNPTERLISAFKLYKIGLGDKEMENFSSDLRRAIDEGGTWMEQQDAFNDYETALNRYRSVFSRVIFLKYDDLFCNPGVVIDRMKNEAELIVDEKAYKEILENKVNSLADTAPVSDLVRREIDVRYHDRHAFIVDYFESDCRY